MRLTPLEIEKIVFATTPFLNGHTAELRLYGSRVHDHLKGGDIDLLLIVDHERLADPIKLKKHRLISKIKEQLGDRNK